MKHRQLLAILSLTLCGVLNRSSHAQTGWHSDLSAAQRIAQRDHKPLFVVFRCER
ncbi:MAG: hypothetical protein ABGZ17_20565 [Planctomycetaceae bacterium]